MDDLKTHAENTWCPGCGNFGILNAFKKAVARLEERGIEKSRLMMCAGIGCHGKIYDYASLSGVYSIHGRSMATAEGIKLANPDLRVIAFAGDGDALGEGVAHTIFAAKRNADMSLVVHDNGVYGLTTGQYTPTSFKGQKGPSTPRGTVEEPINALALMLEAGATFVARGYPGKLAQLADIFVQAVEHEGFSYVHVLQPCVSWNDTYKLYNELTEVLDKTPDTFEDAMAAAKRTDKLPIGVIYKSQKPSFHKALYGDFNPIVNRMPKSDKREAVAGLLQP
jgi:2-oxoglutarate ferredoxin oxidoreductase subunit beta